MENVLIQDKENYNNITFGEPRAQREKGLFDFIPGFGSSSAAGRSASTKASSKSGADAFGRPGATKQFYYYYADIYILVEAIDNYDNL